MQAGYRTHGKAYLLFPLPVLSSILALMLAASTVLSIIFLPVPFAMLVMVEIMALSAIAFFGH